MNYFKWREQGRLSKQKFQRSFIFGKKFFILVGKLALAVQKNHNNYIVSLANLCRWLAEQAEKLGVEIFPGFPASEVLYNEDGSIKGVATLDMGLDKDGNKKMVIKREWNSMQKLQFSQRVAEVI